MVCRATLKQPVESQAALLSPGSPLPLPIPAPGLMPRMPSQHRHCFRHRPYCPVWPGRERCLPNSKANFSEHKIRIREFSDGLAVRDSALSLLWFRFNPWPRNFHVLWAWPKRNSTNSLEAQWIDDPVLSLQSTHLGGCCGTGPIPGQETSAGVAKKIKFHL